MGTTPPEEANRPYNIFEIIIVGFGATVFAMFAAALAAISVVYAWRFFWEAIS